MKNYVVGIVSMFDNEMKLLKVQAESEYEAVKIGMINFYEDEGSQECETNWQNAEEYPKDFDGLILAYEEMPFKVIEI